MSFSNHFGTKAPSRFPKQELITDEEYKQLHWTQQLELRPLGSRKRYEWPQGDFNTHIDMFDDNEIADKEIT